MTLKEMIEKAPFEPLLYRILVKIEGIKEKTDGGILIPEGSREYINRQIEVGVILKIGSLCFYDFATKDKSGIEVIGIQVGDRITFAKHAGEYCMVEGEDYRLINDTDITGKVKEGVKL